MNRWPVKMLSLLLALLLGLAACNTGGKPREVHKVDWVASPAYLAEDIPLPVQTGDLRGCCTDGEYMYLLVDEKAEEGVRSVLSRVSLSDGTAEEMTLYQPPSAEAESFHQLGPILASDGTLWVYEAYSLMYFDFPEDYDPEKEFRMKYYTGQDDFYHLRQLDPKTGKQKKLVDLSEAVGTLDMDSIYNINGFAVDGGGNLYFAASGSVTVSDGKGKHLFTLEADMLASLNNSSYANTAGGSLALLPDGTVAVLTTLPGGKREVRTIDAAAGSWGGARYTLPGGVDLIYDGTGGFLFFYTQGSDLFAWEPESEAARHLLTWSDTGLEGSTMCFAPLDGGKLAALTLQYTTALTSQDSWYEGRLRLSLLSPTGRDPNAGKPTLIYGTIFADSKLREKVSLFNQENGQYIIEIRDYAGENVDAASLSDSEYTATLQAAYQRLRAEVAAGRIPDIWDSSLQSYIYARKGYLEDLWPWIEGDEEIGGREGVMSHALECMSQDGKLYEVSATFFIATAAARADIVGQRTGWTLEEMLECWRQMPEGSTIAAPYMDGNFLLTVLIFCDNGRWVDWANGTCHFDSQEFKDLLELCRQVDQESDPAAFGNADARFREGVQLINYIFLESPRDILYYEALCSGPENLTDYESYLYENNIYPSLIDADGNFRPAGSIVNYDLGLAEQLREQGGDSQLPLAADVVFGALEGGGYVSYPGFPSQERTGNRIDMRNKVGMSAFCRYKEGAWAYIRQCLLPDGAGPIDVDPNAPAPDRQAGFPVNKEAFDKFLAPRWFTRSNGEYFLDAQGNRIEASEGFCSIPELLGDEEYMVMMAYNLAPNEAQRENFMRLYESIQPTPFMGTDLLDIVRDQALVYFAGDKSLEETVELIQNRATLYVNENR